MAGTAAAGSSSAARRTWTSSARSVGREPSSAVLAVLATAVALLPLVAPKGPQNLAPIDGLFAIGILGAMIWAQRTHAVVRLPYVVPLACLVITGSVAALTGVSPFSGSVAMVQEIFLFAWAVAVVTVCRTPRAVAVLLRTWALSATAWALVLVLALLTGQDQVAGAETGLGSRARLFFDHPNMAGNYFMIAVFIVVASGCPRRISLRILACLLLLLAMFFTGSNASLLSLIGAAVLAVFLHLRARAGLVRALAVVTSLVVLLGIAWVEVATPLITAAAQSDNALVQFSVGRGERSAEGRSSLFLEQLELYERGDLLGIGPASTRETLTAESATTAKEAHNDYLAALVERGPLGALSLVGLVAAVGARAVGLTRRPLTARLAAAVPVPAALVGACGAFALTALTHEILHYRWFWTLLAVVAAMHLLLRQEEEGPGQDAGPPATTEGDPESAPARGTAPPRGR